MDGKSKNSESTLQNVQDVLRGLEVILNDEHLLKFRERITRIDMPDPAGVRGKKRKSFKLTLSSGKKDYVDKLPKGAKPGAIFDTKSKKVIPEPKAGKERKGKKEESPEYLWEEEGIHSPYFKRWFGDWEKDPKNASKVVGRDGKPLQVFHGTTNIFDAFNTKVGNIENDFGRGAYFTTSKGDVNVNYAGEGPDLTSRIEILAERIEQEEEIDHEEAKKKAKKQLTQHKGAVIPAYLNIRKPVVLGGDDETFLDYEYGPDEDDVENFMEDAKEQLMEEYNVEEGEDPKEYFDEDEVRERAREIAIENGYENESGLLVEFIEALKRVSSNYEEVDISQAVQELMESAYEGISAGKAIDQLKQSEGLMYATDDAGNHASSEIIREAFERMGFDGVIDRSVAEKFGSRRKGGKPMEGVDEDTVHYIAFEPTQVKSSIGNKGTFDPDNPKMTKDIFDGLGWLLRRRKSPKDSSIDKEAVQDTLLGLKYFLEKTATTGKPFKQIIQDIKSGAKIDMPDPMGMQGRKREEFRITPASGKTYYVPPDAMRAIRRKAKKKEQAKKQVKLIPITRGKYGEKFFFLSIKNDAFVHFTTPKRAKQIMESGKLLMKPPSGKFGTDTVDAVSLTYGTSLPGVQTTHIEGGDVVAVKFRTKTKPLYGRSDETKWDRDVDLIDPKIVSVKDAVRALKRTPRKLGEQDQVIYDLDRAKEIKDYYQSPSKEAIPYPKVKDNKSDGRVIRDKIPNLASIDATLTDYKEVPGIRDIPLSEFDLTGKSYDVSGTKRIKELAEAIKQSGEINPLIVVMDNEGLYILEGGHRAEALHRLGAKSLPAKLVIDLESIDSQKTENKEESSKQPWQMTRDNYGKYSVANTVSLADSKRGGFVSFPAVFIRFGALPRNKEGKIVSSKNYATGKTEPGVSVVAAWKDPKTGKYVLETGGAELIGSIGEMEERDVHLVDTKGSADTGSDGEPVINPDTIRGVKNISRADIVTEDDPYLTLAGEELPEDEIPNWSEAEGGMRGSSYRRHEEAVKRALKEGKPVPKEVLADYPELIGKEKFSESSIDKEAIQDTLFGLQCVLEKAKKGKPGEHRFWDSKRSSENPQGEVRRLPDPPKIQGQPSPQEEDLWVEVQHPRGKKGKKVETQRWKLNDEQMKRLDTPEAKAGIKVVGALRKGGHEAYFVGGAVRDILLGKKPKDYDVVTSARPKDVAKVFPKTYEVGADFAITPVMQDGEWIEIATYRTESGYSDKRHPDEIKFADSVEADAKRRDFTINGLYLDPVDRNVVDSVGGVKDLKDKTIRTIGKPDDRFNEDALRLMRAVRFAAVLDFKIDPATGEAITRLSSTIDEISSERVRDELLKMLTKGGAARGIDLMERTGLLRALPEVQALRGVEQPKKYHPEGDVMNHTLKMLGVLDKTVKNPSVELAMAVLLHDIGKPVTAEKDEKTGKMSFHEHAEKSGEMARDVASRLKLKAKQRERIANLAKDHMVLHEASKMNKKTLRKWFLKPHFEDLLELARIDALGGSGDLDDYDYAKEKYEEFKEEREKYQEPVFQGRDLVDMGFKPGAHFGPILEEVRDLQLDGKITTFEEAKKYVEGKWSPDKSWGETDVLTGLKRVLQKVGTAGKAFLNPFFKGKKKKKKDKLVPPPRAGRDMAVHGTTIDIIPVMNPDVVHEDKEMEEDVLRGLSYMLDNKRDIINHSRPEKSE